MATDPSTLPSTEAVGEVRRLPETMLQPVKHDFEPEDDSELTRYVLLAEHEKVVQELRTERDLLRGLLRDHIEEIGEAEAALADPAPNVPAEDVRRRVEQVLGDLDVDAIERRWLAQCAACDAGLPEYGCSHPDEDYRPTMLRLVEEVRRLRALQRTVLLSGQGFVWRDPATGQEKLLAPQDVTVVLRAEQTELWPDPEGWLPPLAAEKLFEQRDTAIAERDQLREAYDVSEAQRKAYYQQAMDALDERNAAIRERDAILEAARLLVSADRRRSEIERHGVDPEALLDAEMDLEGHMHCLAEAVDAYTTKEASDG